MTNEEFTTIKEYLSSEPFQFRPRMEKFMKTVVIEEETIRMKNEPQNFFQSKNSEK